MRLRNLLPLAAIGLPLLQGCYTFKAVEPAEVEPGEEVQLVLARQATREMVPVALMGEQAVQGDFVELTQDSIAVSVWIGRAYRGTPFEPVHQTYTFPHVDVSRVERRVLAPWRTAFSAAGVVALVAILIDRVSFLEDPNPPPDGSPPPEPPTNSDVIWHWR